MLASLSLSFLVAGVSSHPQYVAMLPNGANVTGVAAIGHVNPAGGGARNAFGDQFWAEWVNKFGWNSTFCCLDADSDGQTNGMELGDPCESPSLSNTTPLEILSLTRPTHFPFPSYQAACGRLGPPWLSPRTFPTLAWPLPRPPGPCLLAVSVLRSQPLFCFPPPLAHFVTPSSTHTLHSAPSSQLHLCAPRTRAGSLQF